MNTEVPDSNIFSIRIVSLDYYMAPPIPDLDICYSDFQGQSVTEVPVIRIYGSTLAGQKTCLHIHQALPYLYVPCSDISPQITQEGHAYMHLVASGIENALKSKGSAGCKRQHIHGCSLVRARRLYGYHSSEELFMKIYLYYPHEVARVATLLLGGGVLNQSFQPHESHVPYLLQFLVDYNLYGMGHLHLSKVKFRLPLPEDFIPRTSRFNNHFRRGRENCFYASGISEATSSSAVHSDLLIWLSSTVPIDWKWGCPVTENVGGSLNGEIYLVKRQSICELEGDADVAEILNQQHKTYIPLSQAGSDMKMVQSLVPIWEEEYARSGTQGRPETHDTSKPSPENVLRSLSEGMELENALFELCNKGYDTASLNVTSSKDDEMLVQCTVPSTKMRGFLSGGEHVLNSDNANSEPLLFLKDENLTGLVLPLPSFRVKGAIPPELGSEPARVAPTNEELTPSANPRTTNAKAVDVEALGLLRWLASSQSVEDISTDDELIHEIILSPLLPTTTMEKVLEKAHLDYESESQKECQDILDSVEDTLKPDGLSEQPVYSESDNHMDFTSILSKDVIPQVDGFWDEKLSTHNSDNSSERKMNNELEKNSPCQTLGDKTASFSGEPKRNKSLWGTLPLSSKEEVHKDSESTHHMPMRICTQGTKSIAEASSVRDLMRRKRCYRGDASEHGNHGVKKVVSRQEPNDGETFSSPGQIVSHIVGSYTDAIKSSGTPNLKLSPIGVCAARCKRGTCSEASGLGPSGCNIQRYQALPFSALDKNKIHAHMLESFDQDEEFQLHDENEKLIVGPSCLIHGPVVDHKNNQENLNEMEGVAEVPCDNHAKTCSSIAPCILHVENDTSKALVLETCSFEPGRASKEVPNTENFSSEYMEMAFHMKPPTVELVSKNFEDASLQPAIHDALFRGNVGIDSLASTSSLLYGENVDNFPPFFTKDSQRGKEFHDKHDRYNEAPSFHQDTMLGIPTYYQNDGSILFILTPVFSPPSFACVHRWLLQVTERDRMNEAIVPCRDKLPMSLEFTDPTFLRDSEDFIHANDEYKCSQHEETFSVPQSIDAAISDKLIITQDSQEDAGKAAFPCSDQSPHAKPMLDHSSQEIHGSPMAGSEANHTSAEAKPHGKKNCGQEKCWSGHCQEISQISGPSGRSKLTPLSQIGFRDPANVGAGQQLTVLSIEVHAESRGDLQPDPQYDAINVIAIAVQEDTDHVLEVCVLLRVTGEPYQRNLDGISGCKVVIATGEKDLFDLFVKLVCSLDPDILMGWEIQGASLGFLAERAAHLGIGLLKNISRTPVSESKLARGDSADAENHMLNNILPEGLIVDAIIEDEWGRTHNSGIHVGGRIVLNIWRIMRAELKLNMYNLEAVAEAVLRRKIPSITFRILSQWFSSGPGYARFRCIEYVADRAKLNLEIMNQLDMINRTSELARVFGIDFFSVLSRGSQYRVESMLLRLAHTQNYLALSPSSQQVASQPAMECLPLVMEPESGFYADPVVVLDFQSLYPSMIIAYNLCFCTCLGKVVPVKANVLGVSSFAPEPQILSDLKHQLMVTPNGVMYVPSKVHRGVLPRLLEELLSTRIMVKQAVKKLKTSQSVLHRIFNARQLALKLIANVTYGYTAAGFSGRMPCAELADSIVQCGRRTLETAILFVNAHEEWNARVIYGDTDSMFVLLKGRTREESFRIGQEIASTITALNPYPVTLKMEKVYHPCFLLTKKRYVGYSFESSDQAKPTFDAKGIERVRRDTCPAVAKTLEKSLRLLFEYQDISRIKIYLQRQWTRILSGKLSLQDFVFAKEVRLGTYSARSSSLPPAAIVASKAMRADPRAEPRYGERIPYVVIHGEPGARLVDMVVDPLDVLEINSPYRLNDLYYINKQIIPALQRVFGLVGADLNQWFSEMPRPVRPTLAKRHLHISNLGFASGFDGEQGIGKKAQAHRTRIDSYYLSRHCTLCEELVQASSHLCDNCCKNGHVAATVTAGKTSKLEREIQHLAAICRHCGGGDWIVESGVKCTSLACSVFYERRKVQKELRALSNIAAEMGFYPRCNVEWF